MKKNFLVVFVIALAMAISCANNYPTRLDPPGTYGMGGAPGSLFGSSKGNVSCQNSNDSCIGQTVGSKTGEACASIFLGGLIAYGDMSVVAAARHGKVTKIGSVDYSQLNVLGLLFLQKCTIVSGD